MDVTASHISKGTAKTSYPAKAVLGKSLANLKGLSVANVKSELTQIRNRVNALIETLNNLPEVKTEQGVSKAENGNGDSVEATS